MNCLLLLVDQLCFLFVLMILLNYQTCRVTLQTLVLTEESQVKNLEALWFFPWGSTLFKSILEESHTSSGCLVEDDMSWILLIFNHDLYMYPFLTMIYICFQSLLYAFGVFSELLQVLGTHLREMMILEHFETFLRVMLKSLSRIDY